MPVTVAVSNLSLCHKISSDPASGSTTVKADGNPIAVKGCNFAMSTGDEAGSAGGGVKSSKFKGKSEFILTSFDVELDGKNACRLTDRVIRAGGTPEIGDVNRKEDSSLLRAVAKALEPATYFRECVLFNGPFANRAEAFMDSRERRFLDRR